MNNVLGYIAFPCTDDVIIPSTIIEDGLEQSRLVLEAIRKYSLTLKASKRLFFRKVT